MNTYRSVALVLLLCTLSSSARASSAVAGIVTDAKILVRSGDSALPSPVDPKYDWFRGQIFLNNSGLVAFDAELEVMDNHDRLRGVWVSSLDAPPSLVAVQGGDAPFLGGPYHYTELHGFNNNGTVAFSGFVFRPGSTTQTEGLWLKDPDSENPQIVTYTDRPAPGTSGNMDFLSFRSPRLSESGDLFFSATTHIGSSINVASRGYWSGSNARNLRLIVNTDLQAPGLPDGVLFNDFPKAVPADALGGIAFEASLIGPGLDFYSKRGVWRHDDTGLHQIATGGQPLPDVPSDSIIYQFSDVASAPAGKTYFTASLEGPEIVYENSQSIWLHSASGDLSLLAQSGDMIDHSGEALELLSFIRPFSYENGVVTQGYSRRAEPGSPTIYTFLKFQDGMEPISIVPGLTDAPGTEIGTTFQGRLYLQDSNSHGQFAFTAQLEGAGLNPTNGFGLWAVDRNDEVQLIARSGDTIDVDNGPGQLLKTIDELGPRTASMNDLGQIAFVVRFTDGDHAIVISNTLAVPEPSGIILAVLGALCIAMPRTLRWKRGHSTFSAYPPGPILAVRQLAL